MSNLLIDKRLSVKGISLDARDMLRIADYFRRATVQQRVFENSEVGFSEEDALKVADRAIGIMDDSNYCEDDAINIARIEFGFKPTFFE